MIRVQHRPDRDVRRAELVSPAKSIVSDNYGHNDECEADRIEPDRQTRVMTLQRQYAGMVALMIRQGKVKSQRTKDKMSEARKRHLALTGSHENGAIIAFHNGVKA